MGRRKRISNHHAGLQAELYIKWHTQSSEINEHSPMGKSENKAIKTEQSSGDYSAVLKKSAYENICIWRSRHLYFKIAEYKRT
jgi:hypothetical protein